MYSYNETIPKPFYIDGKLKIVTIIDKKVYLCSNPLQPIPYTIIDPVPANVMALYFSIIDQSNGIEEAVTAAAMYIMDKKLAEKFSNTLSKRNSEVMRDYDTYDVSFCTLLVAEAVNKISLEDSQSERKEIFSRYADYFITHRFLGAMTALNMATKNLIDNG